VTSSQIVVFAVGVAATAALYGWFRLASEPVLSSLTTT